MFIDGVLGIERLTAEEIQDDSDWQSREVLVPHALVEREPKGDSESIGVFTLRKAAAQLVGRRKHLNAIVVMDDKDNPVAYYPIYELALPGHSTQLGFLYGELRLAFPGVEDLVANDREKLVRRPATEAILTWTAEEIWQQVQALEKQRRQVERRSELEIAAELNRILNQHARRFLEQLETEILVDYIETPSGGGDGAAGLGGGPLGDNLGTSERKGPGQGSGDGTGMDGDGRGGSGPLRPGPGGREDQPGKSETSGRESAVRRTRFPRVLLSAFDPDPAGGGDAASKALTELHPPLYQDDIDRRYNVWWINTAHPFASEAMKHGGARGSWFKSYHLFMFVQVVQLESLRFLQRRQTELALDEVENELTEMTNRFLAELPVDLVDALLGGASAS